MTAPQEVVRRILAGRGGAPADCSTAYAPANIALVKYWGKRDDVLNLPVTNSLSISLGPLGTQMELSRLGGSADKVILNGEELPASSGFVRRATAFLDGFRPTPDFHFQVKTVNTVPTAAGLASSASGFAALVQALNGLFGWGLSVPELSILARMGSGSAARSIEEGFVEWQAGVEPDGMDSFARRLPEDWPDFRVGALVICAGAKPVGSREGMRRSVQTCPFYREWPRQVAADLGMLHDAIRRKDFAALGDVAEANALAMHALMLATRPPILYALPETVAAMRKVWQARQDGVPVWLTMDAGPNVKLLFPAGALDRVRELFPDVEAVAPFGEAGLNRASSAG